MKFSVTVPAYKADFLDEAINSVLNQTYRDWELIILDDCSPWNIRGIVDKYVHDERVRYYRNETNVGGENVVDNWNKCLDLAEGDYIICMGDDDVLCLNCLEIYAKYIATFTDYNIYHGFTVMINEESEVISIQEARPLTESVYSMAWHRIFRKRNQYIGDFLFKISYLKKVGGFYKLPSAWGSDDISTYICAFQKGIVNLPEIVFKYRINRYSISSTGSVESKLRAIAQKQEWIRDNLILTEVSDKKDRLYQKLIQDMFPQSIYREQVSTIAGGLKWRSLGMLFRLVKRKKSFMIDLKQIFFAILLNIARKSNL